MIEVDWFVSWMFAVFRKEKDPGLTEEIRGQVGSE
jgi:hypothetical protein